MKHFDTLCTYVNRLHSYQFISLDYSLTRLLIWSIVTRHFNSNVGYFISIMGKGDLMDIQKRTSHDPKEYFRRLHRRIENLKS